MTPRRSARVRHRVAGGRMGLKRMTSKRPRVAPKRGPDAPMRPRGAGADERSFEQRRRGGPVTGSAGPKARGPRHGGGGKRRGRDLGPDVREAARIAPPFEDYDEL